MILRLFKCIKEVGWSKFDCRYFLKEIFWYLTFEDGLLYNSLLESSKMFQISESLEFCLRTSSVFILDPSFYKNINLN